MCDVEMIVLDIQIRGFIFLDDIFPNIIYSFYRIILFNSYHRNFLASIQIKADTMIGDIVHQRFRCGLDLLYE